MSDIPSKSDLNDALLKVANLVERFRQVATETTTYATTNSSDMVTDVNALISDGTWPGGEGVSRAARNFRATIGNTIRSTIRDMYAPILQGYLKAAGYAETTQLNATAFRRIRDYMASGTAATVKERNITWTSTLGGKVGTGSPTFRVCTVDAYGRELEAAYPERTLVEAKATGSSVPYLREKLEFYSLAAVDYLSYRVSGEGSLPRNSNLRTSFQFENADRGGMRNLSFDSQSSAGALTEPGGWTINSGSATVVDDAYRASIREKALIDAGTISNGLSWQWDADFEIEQPLRGVVDNTCYDAGVLVKRTNSATGTVTMTVGGVSFNVSLASLTNGVWTLLALPLTEDNWARSIKAGDKLKIAGASIATGEVAVDSAFFNPMVEHNGVFWNAIQDGTALSVDFAGSFTHTFPDQGYIQQHMLIGFGGTGNAGRDAFLNSASSPTIAETGI